MISFVEDNQSLLDHINVEVGFDYKMKNGKLQIVKTGYYGTF